MLPPVQDCPDYFLTILTITNVRFIDQFVYHDYRTLFDFTSKLKNHDNMKNYSSIISHKEGAVCGRRLQAGMTYLIMGRLPQDNHYPSISLCATLVEQLNKIPTNEEAQQMLIQKFNQRCTVPNKIDSKINS